MAEEPVVIEHRSALVYMLAEASELEHGIMCEYLFAGASRDRRRSRRGDEDMGAPVAP